MSFDYIIGYFRAASFFPEESHILYDDKHCENINNKTTLRE